MKNTARNMFIFGIVAFILVTLIVHRAKFEDGDFAFWVFRVLIALAAASISISIPGMLEIKYVKDNNGMQMLQNADGEPEPSNLLEKEPAITASGAIAVFVLVYLFNPIG
ncbi:hypothetical protein EJ994_14725 [Maribacter sp. MJ134]|uniref:hypothetical protein n=1 Tax=Maribacter sp. MJ134 TaxID=2496865 RepID=UPI000F81CB02|nr:hypothetical protein [Maribacter sp. MJ134]AZQ59991.1 hypothetical protein EJ994_14725 [Maribacter sp. MJ134]